MENAEIKEKVKLTVEEAVKENKDIHAKIEQRVKEIVGKAVSEGELTEERAKQIINSVIEGTSSVVEKGSEAAGTIAGYAAKGAIEAMNQAANISAKLMRTCRQIAFETCKKMGWDLMKAPGTALKQFFEKSRK